MDPTNRSHPIPGLPIGNCAGSSNNLIPRVTKLSATNETVKAFFERLYLVLGLSSFEPRVSCPYTLTSPLLIRQLFLDFCAIFFLSGPSFFCQHTIHKVIWPSSGTLILNLTKIRSRLWPRYNFEESESLVSTIQRVSFNAGRMIKCAPWKSLRFSEHFLGILLSEFRCTVFLPLDWEWKKERKKERKWIHEGYHEGLRETPS